MNSRYNDLSLCASGIGCRVVRGPDWKWGNQDGGSGHVGSLRRFEARGEAVVLWDSGIVANYRCGALGFDLRVLDSSPTGRRHLDTICEGCNESPIYGIRWKCMLCLNVDLCSSCYHGDKHCLSHPFLRIATPHGVRVAVGRRSKAQKTDAVGLFPRARVVRGFDWRWGTQDCATVVSATNVGSAGAGTSLTNTLIPQTTATGSSLTNAPSETATPCQGRIVDRRDWFQWAPKSAVSVAWDSGAYNVYRVGYMGMVDLKAVRPAKGGSYYAEHLPLLGDLRDLPSQLDMETNTPSASIAIPQAPSQPTDNIVWTAPPRNRNQHAHTEVYEDSGIIDSGDRIPLTDAEGGTRPSSVPIQRPRTSGGGSNSNTRTLLSDLFCAGGGGGASAPSEDGIVPSGASSPPVITSRPSTAVRNRTQSGLPPAYRSSALRLRPGAVIQLRLRSMVNENAIATATTPGSEYLSLPSVVERVDDSNGSVVLLIPQTGQRFTLTSSATATCQHQQPTSERMVSRHASANASLLTRMRRRDSYARAAAAAAASTGCEGIATVGETGLVENQQSQETSTQPGNQQDSHESSITRSLLKQSSKQVAEELMFAAAEGNVKKITWLIKHREIDVNTHYAGATALHVACQSGHLNCVDVLLQHGADCRERDADGNQALHAAAQGGALPVLRRIAATLSLLVEREPQPSSSNSTAPQELTLPPDVNARNALRQTPLHLATVGRHLDCARSLLEEFNALPSLQDCDGDTPLHDAVSGENLAMVELLLANRADLAITNSLGHNCLHHAAMLGNPGVFCALVSYCDQMPWLLDEARPDGFTPLHLAVLYGHTAIADCLLLLPPQATTSANTGASSSTDHSISLAAVNVNAESALMLGSSSGATLGNRLTPLHLAVQKGNAPIVCLLLAHGALPCVKDASGKSPLDLSLALLKRSIKPTFTEQTAPNDANLTEQSDSSQRAVAEGNRIELSMVPFLASVARYLVTCADSGNQPSIPQNEEDQSLHSLPSSLRSRIESVIQTALNSGISVLLLISSCLVAAVGLQSRSSESNSDNQVTPPSCLSTLEDSVLELALQQCFLEACLASTASTDVTNSETSALNDFFTTDNRSESRVLQSGTVSPTGSSMSIANFLVPSEWSANGAPMMSTEMMTQQQLQQPKPADLPLNLDELGEELRECMVCSSRDRAALLSPCGHIVACQNCTQLLKKCIICRQPVDAYREIPACRECTFRPAVTLTRTCNHFLVCRECLIPRVARLNRALEAAGDDDDEQSKPEWLLAETESEQRRHQLLLSLFNAGELCPDGMCPECGQAVSAVWSIEVAVSGRCGIERILTASSTSGRSSLIPANATQDLLVPITVSQSSTVWVTSENNQVEASTMNPRCLVPKSIYNTTLRQTLPRCTQAGGSNARPNNMRPSGSVVSSGQSSSKELKRLQHELQAMREQTRCPICLDRSRNLVFMCGHATCQWCGDQVAVCPICRRTVTGRIVLY